MQCYVASSKKKGYLEQFLRWKIHVDFISEAFFSWTKPEVIYFIGSFIIVVVLWVNYCSLIAPMKYKKYINMRKVTRRNHCSVQYRPNSAATMKVFVLTAAFVFVVTAIPTNEWTQYKEKYQKVYTSTEEDLLRYNQYLKTKKKIEEHNIRYERGETTYWMGINHFSDWFPEEINKMIGKIPNKLNKPISRGKPFELPEGTPVPDSINWVKKGAVTSVKDQKKCNSGYAFSGVGALEGLMFITNKTITDLSAQEMVDCILQGPGCAGNDLTNIFFYVAWRNGIDTSASYPYTGVVQKCKADAGVFGATCSGFEETETEENLKYAVGTVGPVAIFFFASDSLISYKGGIFDGDCDEMRYQQMLAVGYDRDNKTGKDYWLVKNSWGEDWGEKGYIRIIRNVNKCDLAILASYPVYFY